MSSISKTAMELTSESAAVWWSVKLLRNCFVVALFVLGTAEAAEVRSLTVSPDSRYVLSSSNENSLRLWELKSGNLKATWTTVPNAVGCSAFSPSGKQAVTRDDGEVVRLWDVESGKEIRNWNLLEDVLKSRASRGVLNEKPDFHVRQRKDCVAIFSRDAKAILTVGDGGFFALDSSGEKLAHFPKQKTNHVVALPDGVHILISGIEGGVVKWNLKTKTIVASNYDGFDLFSESENLAIAYKDRGLDTGKLLYWNAKELVGAHSMTRQQIWVTGSNDQFRSIIVSGNGARLLTLGDRIQLWDVKQRTLVRDFGAASNPKTMNRPTDLGALSYDGKYVFVARSGGKIDVYLASKGQLTTSWKGHSDLPEPKVFTGADFLEAFNKDTKVQGEVLKEVQRRRKAEAPPIIPEYMAFLMDPRFKACSADSDCIISEFKCGFPVAINSKQVREFEAFRASIKSPCPRNWKYETKAVCRRNLCLPHPFPFGH